MPLIYYRVTGFFRDLLDNKPFWDGLIIFLGSLFLLIDFPFYPVALSIVLALLAGFVGSRKPYLGLVVGLAAAYPAVVYQSPLLGWMAMPVIAAVLFTMFKYWNVIAFIEIVLFAPFAPYPFSLFGGFVFFLMTLFSLYLGSKRSLMFTVPTVFMITMISSIWLVQNSVFMPVDLSLYQPGDIALMPVRDPPSTFFEFASALKQTPSTLFDPSLIGVLTPAFFKILSNMGTLFINDSLVLQMILFGGVFYVVGAIPGFIRRFRYKQTVASLVLFIIPFGYGWICEQFGYAYNNSIYYYVGAAVLLVFIMERYNINVSRERLIFLRERAKKFGKFGLRDLEEAAGVSSLKDVGDYEDVKEELKRSIMLPLEHHGVAHAYGIRPPNGILLFGPPGTGKTLIMTALAKELDYGFYYVKSSEILGSRFGESEKNITELFDIARRNAPCILFFDEIDAIAKRRDMLTSEESLRVLSQFLQELDGFKEVHRAVVIGATNVPHLLDPALLRPGRFDVIIYMPLPDKRARLEIFKVHTRKLPLADDVDLEKLAEKTERFSGADIAHVCAEAKRNAASRALEKGKLVPITMKDFLDVIKHMKPSVSLSQLEMYERFRLDYERSYRKEMPEKGELTFDDVADLENVKQILKENIELPLLHPDLMKEYKLKPIHGLLLYGPPGCGKTMVVKAAANELDIPMLSISGAELLRQGYEYSIRVIKETFNRARENAPAIIFIDEIDTLGEQSIFGRSVIGQLLVEMDGIRNIRNVMVIATSNKPWLLDNALLRPGRFDKSIYVPLPNAETRKELFILNLKDIKGFDEVDLDRAVRLTEGYSGADIVAVCDEVKRMLVRIRLGEREGKPVLNDKLIEEAINSVPPSVNDELLEKFKEFAKKHRRKH